MFMRNRFEVQLALGATPIEKLDFPTTREVTSAVMKSLQWIFVTPEVNQAIFQVLEDSISPKQKNIGRKGMDLWTILVLGVLRLARNFSYDELHDMANNHTQIKQLMGRTHLDTDLKFSLTSLKENIPLLSEEVLGKINHIIAGHGVSLTQKKTTKASNSKLTATSTKPTFISRLISILPTTASENASGSPQKSRKNTI